MPLVQERSRWRNDLDAVRDWTGHEFGQNQARLEGLPRRTL